MSNPLSDGWGDFLGEFAWDWFVTLTFAGDAKTFTARNRCNAWLKMLEKAAGRPITWFRGDEYGDKFGKFHMHLLIGNVAHLHRFTWMKIWEDRNGFARIHPFEPEKGAAYYVAKYVTKQFGEWELSENIAAFRVQQNVLPLAGQKGSPDTRNIARPVKAAPRRRRSGERTHQIPIANFTAPGSGDVDADPIRANFREQTKRKR